jgi:hypothetical protein
LLTDPSEIDKNETYSQISWSQMRGNKPIKPSATSPLGGILVTGPAAFFAAGLLAIGTAGAAEASGLLAAP